MYFPGGNDKTTKKKVSKKKYNAEVQKSNFPKEKSFNFSNLTFLQSFLKL